MNAIILSVGDELILGQTVDTNSAWLSQQLAAAGCDILRHMTVGDDQPAIESAITESVVACDLLLISGGIGPTEDDLTRQALAMVLKQPLTLNEVWLKELQNFFAARGRQMPEINKIQAMIPRGAEMIFNHAGTAAGIHAVIEGSGFRVRGSVGEVVGSASADAEPLERTGTNPTKTQESLGHKRTSAKADPTKPCPPQSQIANRDSTELVEVKSQIPPPRTLNPHSCHIFVMPGVPKEMKAMFTRDVLPHVRAQSGGAVILSRTLHTFGQGESAIGEMLGDLMRRNRNPSVGTTVSGGVVSVRINARFPSRERAQGELERTAEACRSALGDLIYGQDEQTLQEVVADLLFSRNQSKSSEPFTVTTAESCTGGLLAKMLTDISGSSAYFSAGFVTYANSAKHEWVDVPQELLDQHGAVSEPVVKAMATGALRRARAQAALAISGVAGPTGGSPEKPVGTVWLALASEAGANARKFLFSGDREMIRDRAAKMALTMLRFHLLGQPLPF